MSVEYSDPFDVTRDIKCFPQDREKLPSCVFVSNPFVKVIRLQVSEKWSSCQRDYNNECVWR